MTSIIFLIVITLISILVFNVFFEAIGKNFFQNSGQSSLQNKTIGLVLTVSLYSALAYLGINFTVIQGIFLLLLFFSLLRNKFMLRFFRVDLYSIFVVLTIVVIIVSFEQTYYDARVGHALTSKGIYLVGSIKEFIEAYNAKDALGTGGMHQFYPKLLPFLSANFTQIIGVWNESIAILGQSLLYVSVVYLIMCEVDEKYKYIAAILLIFGGGANLYAGYQDSTVAILVFLAFLNLYQKKYLIFISCLAISTLVKLDGLMYLLCGALLVSFFYSFKKDFQRLEFLVVIMPILSFIIYKYMSSDWGVVFDARASIEGKDIMGIINRATYIPIFMLKKDFGLLVSITMTLIIFIISFLNKKNRYIRMGLFPLVTFVAYSTYYIVLIPGDIQFFVDHGFSRVLLGCFYCSFFYNLAFIVDLIDNTDFIIET
jgi:hypothetical protein